MSDRETFLQRVRQAVAHESRPGASSPLPERGTLGYQGAGPDAVAKFRDEFTAAGGHFHLVRDVAAAHQQIDEILHAHAARKILVGHGSVLEPLELPRWLSERAFDVKVVDALSTSECREVFFAADVGISGVDYLIAETGTVVLTTRPQDSRSLSLLPPVHIAVAERRQILADLFDLYAELDKNGDSVNPPALPSCITLITGPSKTGDIELRLVTGVHGPGEIHVLLIET